ncbi:MAG: DNA alkylation repair protein [Anaerolineaceae bacterium]|nr:DNA alkylation repair protein [Anaerolineaceae bacterium]
MPSINISKLRFQISELVDHFSDPVHFCKSFYEVLDHYSRRSLRPGDESIAKTFMPTFNCPDQVIKQIVLGLQVSIKMEPDSALDIVDILWQDKYLESRELAAKVLGNLPIEFTGKIMDRIILWAKPNLDKAALELLFSEATHCILRENSKLLEDAVVQMLDKKDIEWQSLGLEALVIMIKNPDYNRVPSLFKLISPFILETDDLVQLKTEAVLSALIERTPIESAYFLKQSLGYSQRNQVERIIRRLLPNFPPDLRVTLLDAIYQSKK